MIATRATFILALFAVILAPIPGEAGMPVAVIPRPMKMEARPGEFVLTPKTAIVVAAEARNEGQYLARLLAPATGFRLEVLPLAQAQERPGTIVLRLAPKRKALAPEGYTLDVLRDRSAT